MIDPGQLNERVQLLAPTVSRGANGEAVNTWGDYGTKWAKVEPLEGTEVTQTDVMMPATRAKFTFRWHTDYTENFRLVWNSQTWAVLSVKILGKKEYIEMLAETNVTQTGDDTVYDDYYLRSSLKVRVITGSAVTTITPTDAQITSDVGMTAAVAGIGYLAFIKITALSTMIEISSDGTNWYYSIKS